MSIDLHALIYSSSASRGGAAEEEDEPVSSSSAAANKDDDERPLVLQEKLLQRGGVDEEDNNNQTGKPHGGATNKKINRKNDRRKRQRTNDNQKDEAGADAADHQAATDASSYDQATNDRATDADTDAETDASPLMARFDLLYQNLNDPNRMAAVPDAALSHGNSSGTSTSHIPVVYYPTAQRRRERSAAVVRRARTLEYNLIRQRWQKRKYDFRDEVDVGNAVAEQVQYSRKVLRKKRRRQKDQQRDDGEDDDEIDIDTFDHTDEEGNILSQLLQPSQEAAEAAQRQQQQQQESETLKPYAEIMNHWEYGRLVPQPDQLEPVLSNPFDYPKMAAAGSISQPNAMDQVRSNDSHRRNDDDDDEDNNAFRLPYLIHPKRNARLTTEFPLHHNPVGDQTSLLQRRQIFRAAARHVTGGGGAGGGGSAADAAATDARCIAALWKLGHRRLLGPNVTAASNHFVWTTTNVLANHQCRRLGEHTFQFLTHRWRDRAAAAASLGLTGAGDGNSSSSVAVIGSAPDHLVGRNSLATLPATDRYWFQKCLQTYGDGESSSSSSRSSTATAAAAAAKRIEWAPPPSLDTETTEPPPPLCQVGTPVLAPQTPYLHLPGTRPPAPAHPLDVTGGILFGPTDRYEQVVQHGAVDENVCKLTISSLLTRLAAARVDATNSDPQQQLPCQWEKQLQNQLGAVLQQTVRLNQNKLYRRKERHLQMNQLELPLAFFYRAVSEYCSVVANGVPLPASMMKTTAVGGDGDPAARKEKDDDDNESDNDDHLFVANQPKLSVIADHLFEFLEKQLEHNGLQMFTDLHITFGILRIAHTLPMSGIEILSRSLEGQQEHHDDLNYWQTPFELVRLLLEHLEESDILVEDVVAGMSSSATDETVVHVGELEYAFHGGATIFRKCVQREPTNVLYHCWHLSALAASLLLCSGHRIIGAGAHPYPSGRTQQDSASQQHHFLFASGLGNNLNDQHSDAAPHEVRRALPKFEELRQETAKAFQVLAHLAQHQRGNRSHRAVASFLEWRQVVALMMGPPVNSDNDEESDYGTSVEVDHYYSNVRSLHRHHAIEWALQEGTAPALNAVLLRDDDSSSLDNRLQGVACALETNPCSIAHWRALVQALGPVGRRVAAEERERCRQSSCTDCWRILNGLNVDHSTLTHRRERGSWWGLERCEWWYESLLQSPSPSTDSPDRTNEIETALEEALGDVEPIVLESTSSSEIGQSLCSRDHPSLDWLEDVLISQGNDDDLLPPREVRSQSVSGHLPQTYRGKFGRSLEDPDFHLEFAGERDSDHCTELIAYKALILCHLYGTWHAGVDHCVCALVRAGYSNSKKFQHDSNAFGALQWLQRMGLDVAIVFQQSQQTKPKDNAARRKTLTRTQDTAGMETRSGKRRVATYKQKSCG